MARPRNWGKRGHSTVAKGAGHEYVPVNYRKLILDLHFESGQQIDAERDIRITGVDDSDA